MTVAIFVRIADVDDRERLAGFLPTLQVGGPSSGTACRASWIISRSVFMVPMLPLIPRQCYIRGSMKGIILAEAAPALASIPSLAR